MKGNSSPIAVVIFNRPNYVKTLRNCLDRQQHRTLYLIVDGPRHNRTDDAKLIEESIDHFSDWGAAVFINKSEVNLGCKARVESGLNWVFEQTETAIILEDDLEPSSQFFDFCDQMLETYSNNKNVMSVCGSRLPPKEFNVAEPIYFSKYQNCWGWATWKDSWQLFKDDYSELSSLTLFFNLKNKLGTMRAAMYWVTLYWMVKSGRRSSWAYCWMITCFILWGKQHQDSKTE